MTQELEMNDSFSILFVHSLPFTVFSVGFVSLLFFPVLMLYLFSLYDFTNQELRDEILKTQT